MKKIKDFDIVACKPAGWKGKIISTFSGQYSHIGIYYKGEVYSARILKGVIKEPFSVYVEGYPELDIYKIEGLTSKKKNILYGYMMGSLGKKYDKIQLIRDFIKSGWGRVFKFSLVSEARRLVCSSFIAYSFYVLGYKLEMPFNYYTPDNIVVLDYVTYKFSLLNKKSPQE